MTKTQRLARERLYRYAWEASRDMIDMDLLRDQVPDAWHTLEQDIDVREKKEKVTLYLDASVARFYRAMGLGYHARINRLLATWAQMKIAEVLRTDAAMARGAAAGGPEHDALAEIARAAAGPE